MRIRFRTLGNLNWSPQVKKNMVCMAVEHKIKIFDMLRNQRVHVEPIKKYTENCFFSQDIKFRKFDNIINLNCFNEPAYSRNS